ncbi:MAG TPA: anti-sigma factor [Propionibacteriaceae bacterium]|jgi:anti-sigma-K factor RskA
MHTNPEVLALLALGENAGTRMERDHVTTCSTCSEEVSELARISDVGRTATATDTLVTPSPEVWQRISAELGFSASTGTATATATRPPAQGGQVTELAARRVSSAAPHATSAGRRFLALAVAAGLALIVGVGIGIGYQQWVDKPTMRVIASAQLKALPAWAGTTGTAQVMADGTGARELVLRVTPAKPVDGSLQVWLMKETVRDPQRMGVAVQNGEARIPIPPGMSLLAFPVVDVSDEPPNDQEPQRHSGNSVARGELS